MNRKPREAETRDAMDRESGSHDLADILGEVGRLDVPAEIIPPDKVYRWVRESSVGAPDTNNWSRRSRRGWTPVPADRAGHDVLRTPSMFRKAGEIDNNIITEGGLVLCEMPKRRYAQVLAALQQRNIDVIQGIQDKLVEGMPTGTPVIVEHDVTTHTLERGGGRRTAFKE